MIDLCMMIIIRCGRGLQKRFKMCGSVRRRLPGHFACHRWWLYDGYNGELVMWWWLCPKIFLLGNGQLNILPVIGDDDEGGDKMRMVVIMWKEFSWTENIFPVIGERQNFILERSNADRKKEKRIDIFNTFMNTFSIISWIYFQWFCKHNFNKTK